jgi:hypothetical protein
VAVPVLRNWVRLGLAAIAGGLVLVFWVALRLRPYDKKGVPLRLETHRQLGLPPCTFYEVTGKPCPACGMTTSFSLLMHGDVVGSLRANSVGTLLALFCLAYIPWAALSVARGRALFVRALDRALMLVVITLLVLLMLRWGVVLASGWLTGTPLRI